jgi:phosphate transport system substrate-binding protein
MSSYSYMITQTSGFDPAKGAVLGTWIIYIACHGQSEAERLGYSPLPPNLVRADFAAVQRIPGAPAPPPVDAAHCDNPTITGAKLPGAGHISGGGGPGSAASAAASAAATAAAATASAQAAGGASDTLTPAVATLGEAQRSALLAQAERDARAKGSTPLVPLMLTAVVILLAVFGPMVLEWRRHERAR